MKKNRIAIIDSGIDVNAEKFRKRIVEGYSIELKDGEDFFISNEIKDCYGHGTNCADMILKYSSSAMFIPIRIINEDGFTSSSLLVEALRLCVTLSVKIILISLSVVVEKCILEKEMYDLCRILDEQGKIVCVSDDNNHINAIPARFNNVIGVRAIYEKYNLVIRKNEDIQVLADGNPEFVVNRDGKYNLFKGNSKANAYVVALINNIILESPDDTRLEVINKLYCKYNKRLVPKESNNLGRLPFGKQEWEITKTISKSINKFKGKKVNIFEIIKLPIICSYTNITYYNISVFLDELNKLYSKKAINYENLDVEKICTLYDLVEYIKEELI